MDAENDVVVNPEAPEQGQADEEDINTSPANEESEQSTDSYAPDESAETGTTFDELAKKKGWQNPDDMAKSYAELERHKTTVEMDRAALMKARNEPKQQPATEAKETTDNSTLAKLLREQREIKEKMELNELFQRYNDAGSYGAKMAAHVKSHPSATWEEAYRFVKFDDLQRQAKAEGRAEAYQNIDAKTKATTTEKAGPRTGAPKDIATLLKDKNVSLSEIEKMLPRG